MAKGLLYLNYFPTRCCDCGLSNCIKLGKTICHVTLKDISDEEYLQKKPDWCPLLELPEKNPNNPELELGVHYTKNGYEIYKSGWNACIDKIMRH